MILRCLSERAPVFGAALQQKIITGSGNRYFHVVPGSATETCCRKISIGRELSRFYLAQSNVEGQYNGRYAHEDKQRR